MVLPKPKSTSEMAQSIHPPNFVPPRQPKKPKVDKDVEELNEEFIGPKKDKLVFVEWKKNPAPNPAPFSSSFKKLAKQHEEKCRFVRIDIKKAPEYLTQKSDSKEIVGAFQVFRADKKDKLPDDFKPDTKIDELLILDDKPHKEKKLHTKIDELLILGDEPDQENKVQEFVDRYMVVWPAVWKRLFYHNANSNDTEEHKRTWCCCKQTQPKNNKPKSGQKKSDEKSDETMTWFEFGLLLDSRNMLTEKGFSTSKDLRKYVTKQFDESNDEFIDVEEFETFALDKQLKDKRQSSKCTVKKAIRNLVLVFFLPFLALGLTCKSASPILYFFFSVMPGNFPRMAFSKNFLSRLWFWFLMLCGWSCLFVPVVSFGFVEGRESPYVDSEKEIQIMTPVDACNKATCCCFKKEAIEFYFNKTSGDYHVKAPIRGSGCQGTTDLFFNSTWKVPKLSNKTGEWEWEETRKNSREEWKPNVDSVGRTLFFDLNEQGAFTVTSEQIGCYTQTPIVIVPESYISVGEGFFPVCLWFTISVMISGAYWAQLEQRKVVWQEEVVDRRQGSNLDKALNQFITLSTKLEVKKYKLDKDKCRRRTYHYVLLCVLVLPQSVLPIIYRLVRGKHPLGGESLACWITAITSSVGVVFCLELCLRMSMHLLKSIKELEIRMSIFNRLTSEDSRKQLASDCVKKKEYFCCKGKKKEGTEEEENKIVQLIENGDEKNIGLKFDLTNSATAVFEWDDFRKMIGSKSSIDVAVLGSWMLSMTLVVAVLALAAFIEMHRGRLYMSSAQMFVLNIACVSVLLLVLIAMFMMSSVSVNDNVGGQRSTLVKTRLWIARKISSKSEERKTSKSEDKEKKNSAVDECQKCLADSEKCELDECDRAAARLLECIDDPNAVANAYIHVFGFPVTMTLAQGYVAVLSTVVPYLVTSVWQQF